MSLNPARLLKLPAGVLKEGAPADFVLFDEARQWTVDGKGCMENPKHTPFHGRTLSGKVIMTVKAERAEIVYQEMK